MYYNDIIIIINDLKINVNKIHFIPIIIVIKHIINDMFYLSFKCTTLVSENTLLLCYGDIQ